MYNNDIGKPASHYTIPTLHRRLSVSVLFINMDHKVLNDLSTAKLLTEMHVLSEWHFIKHDAAYTVSIKHYLQSMSECTKHMDIDYCPKTNIVENGL